MSRVFRCRQCQLGLSGLEVMAGHGGALFVGTGLELEVGFNGGLDPGMGCWLDGYACFDCGTVDLAVGDLGFGFDGLPCSDRPCLVCGLGCRGPLAIECFGVGEGPLAWLGPKFGAPLWGWLCPFCGRVWLSLHPEDSAGRAELVARFLDGGSCLCCQVGRLRATRVDVPYSGWVGLFRPASAAESNPYGASVWVADLGVVVCDFCGDVLVRVWAG